MSTLPELDFRRTPVTLIVTAVAAALEIACTLDPHAGGFYQETLRYKLNVDYRLGMLSPVWSGELWRPLSASLLHGSFLHAAFNIYWTLRFGSALERRFGSPRFALLLLLLAFVSALPQFVISNWNVDDLQAQRGLVGLSGVGYGLFGLLLVGRRYQPELRELCDDTTAWLFGGWFVLCIIMTQQDIMNVANIAHAAGWIFGALYGGAIFARRRAPWLAAAAVATLVVLSTLFWLPPGHKLYQRHRQNEQLRRMWQAAGAIEPPLSRSALMGGIAARRFHSAALVQQSLELGDGIQILNAPGGTLELYQLFQRHAPAGNAEQLQLFGKWQ